MFSAQGLHNQQRYEVGDGPDDDEGVDAPLQSLRRSKVTEGITELFLLRLSHALNVQIGELIDHVGLEPIFEDRCLLERVQNVGNIALVYEEARKEHGWDDQNRVEGGCYLGIRDGCTEDVA